MLEEPLCDDEYEYYTDEDEADIEDEASEEDTEDSYVCDILLPQDEDDTLKSSNSVPDVPGPVRKDSAWRRKFDEADMHILLKNDKPNCFLIYNLIFDISKQIFKAATRSLIRQTRVESRRPLTLSLSGSTGRRSALPSTTLSSVTMCSNSTSCWTRRQTPTLRYRD